MKPSPHTLRLIMLWFVLVLLGIAGRSYIPVDETRYVTVAWNMWWRDDYLVPWLNGMAYSHKPPLLFWLMNAGWAIFGVNDWWPRLVPSLFAITSVLLTMRLAKRLWPDIDRVAPMAGLILSGSTLWIVFSTATMFDMMIACFTLLGMLGVLNAWEGEPRKGWSLVGLAIGLGLLAKGPAILMHILPVALVAPWWGRGKRTAGARWYAGIVAAVMIGAAITLLWAIPAAIHGGDTYARAIFWGQTAERMVASFAHRRPFWWYMPLLPLILFPWLLWAPAWRGLTGVRGFMAETGTRFCLAWMFPVFFAFCMISGKQMHYLLPLLPVFALLVARSLPEAGFTRAALLPAGLFAAALGTLMVLAPLLASRWGLPVWVEHMQQWPGLALIALGLLLPVLRSGSVFSEVWKLTLFSAAVFMIAFDLGLMQNSGLAFDIRPISQQLKKLQDAGVPLAHVGQYPGQYQFPGRMRAEPEALNRGELEAWFKAHPDGKAIVYFWKRRTLDGVAAYYQQPYLDHIVAIIGADAWPVPTPRAP